tara:strand:- start:92 stop:589 length:498 start_codon:yes stop_codon:yes gene_type:complete
MSASTNTTAIVDKMKYYWVNATPNRGFYFGWPQEVDNIHSKTLPLMVMNPPEIIVSTKAWSSNTISTNSNWALITYDVLPSRYNITDDLQILEYWDKMEDEVMFWIYNWWYYYENVLGIEFILTAPIQIIRIKEASNDRLLALKVTFGFNFYRLCANTNDFPNID